MQFLSSFGAFILLAFGFFPLTTLATAEEDVLTAPNFSFSSVEFIQPTLTQEDTQYALSVIAKNSDPKEPVSFSLGLEYSTLDGDRVTLLSTERSPQRFTLKGGEIRPLTVTFPYPAFLSGDLRVTLKAIDEMGQLIGFRFIDTYSFSSPSTLKITGCSLNDTPITDTITLEKNLITSRLHCTFAGDVPQGSKLVVSQTKSPYLALGTIGILSLEKEDTLLFNQDSLITGPSRLEVRLTESKDTLLAPPLSFPLIVKGSGGSLGALAIGEVVTTTEGSFLPLDVSYQLYDQSPYTLTFKVESEGQSCGEPSTTPLSGESAFFSHSFKLTGDCPDPKVTATLTDGNKTVIAERTLGGEKPAVQANQTITPLVAPVSFFHKVKSLFLTLLPWLLVGIIILFFAYRRLHKAKLLFFIGCLFLVGLSGIQEVEAASGSKVLVYYCAPSTACPLASAVYYNYDTDKNVYAPGETITVYFDITSDDHPVGSLCPYVSIGVNGYGGSSDLIPGCYTAQNFRDGLFFSFKFTAPSTPGPFRLGVAMGLSGYINPSPDSLPLSVSPPASCTWPGDYIAWGGSCRAFVGPRTVSHGNTAGPFSNTNSGYTGSYTALCNNGTFEQYSASCDKNVPAPTASIISNKIAYEPQHWWERLLSFFTEVGSVAQASGTTPITAGQGATITWSSTYADGCSVIGGWGSSSYNNSYAGTSGSYSFYGMAAGTHTYSVTCSNTLGVVATDSTTITVNAPPAPTTCSMSSGYRSWGSGCSAYIYAITKSVGEYTGAYSNITSGYTGSVNYYCDASGTFVASNPTCSPVASGPSAPTGLTATPGTCGTGSISLSWNAVSGASSYYVYDNGSYIGYVSSTSYTHSGLTAGSSHSYTVKAYNGSLSSDSNTATATAPSSCGGGGGGGGSTTLDAPGYFTATPGSCDTGTISLAWGSVSGATSYQVREGSTPLYTGPSTTTTITGLVAGSTHTYYVRALNSGGGSSSVSATATAPGSCGGGGGSTFSGSISASGCTISLGGSSCSLSVSWYASGSPVSVLQGSIPFSTSTIGSTTRTIGYGSTYFYLRSGSTTLDYDIATASCNSSAYWDGSRCVSAPPATPTISTGSSCTIPVGGTGCNVSLTWSNATAIKYTYTNTIGTTYNGTTTVSTNASGSTTLTIHGLAGNIVWNDVGGSANPSYFISGICATGSTWDGIRCAANGPSGSITSISACIVPLGDSTCSLQASWTTSSVSAPLFEIGGATPSQSTLPNGTNVSFTLPFGSYSAVLRDTATGTSLDTEGITTVCTAGTGWNGSTCELLPAVDLKVNGSDGPLTFTKPGNMSMSWTSSNATTCTASGPGWTGTKPTANTGESTPIVSGTYSLSCTGNALSRSDSVNVTLSCTPSCDSWGPCGPPCTNGEGVRTRSCLTATCLPVTDTESCSTNACRDLNWKEIGQ